MAVHLANKPVWTIDVAGRAVTRLVDVNVYHRISAACVARERTHISIVKSILLRRAMLTDRGAHAPSRPRASAWPIQPRCSPPAHAALQLVGRRTAGDASALLCEGRDGYECFRMQLPRSPNHLLSDLPQPRPPGQIPPRFRLLPRQRPRPRSQSTAQYLSGTDLARKAYS